MFHLAAHFANQNSVDNPETDLLVNGQDFDDVLARRLMHASRSGGIWSTEIVEDGPEPAGGAWAETTPSPVKEAKAPSPALVRKSMTGNSFGVPRKTFSSNFNGSQTVFIV